jgi:antitoxin component HigA of HigAB toxin-antitoxin module
MPNMTLTRENAGKSPAIADRSYPGLLARFAPVAIETEAQNERALKAVSALMKKPKHTVAETRLLKLFAVLISDFEQSRYSMREATPLEVLRELMSARDMHPRDLWSLVGSRGTTSEILSGKRGISRELARKLGDFFGVRAACFF